MNTTNIFDEFVKENDHKIKQSFCNEPCIEPYKKIQTTTATE